MQAKDNRKTLFLLIKSTTILQIYYFLNKTNKLANYTLIHHIKKTFRYTSNGIKTLKKNIFEKKYVKKMCYFR